ncbi:MAG: hypothetical protein C0434_08040 [Xanthomonadaceae bacterium]|nr:hypothetical protein [Xanthomonadaceae bacterium]
MPRLKKTAGAPTAPAAPPVVQPPAALRAAAPAVSMPAQKYLIDADGIPLPYNAEVHAQNPSLRLVHALPTSYVNKVRAYSANERAAQQAQAAQLAELEQIRLNAIEAENRRAAAAREAMLSHTLSDQAEQDLLTPGTFLISEASAPQLVAFAKENFGTDLDETLPVEELRAEVAMLAGLEAE